MRPKIIICKIDPRPPPWSIPPSMKPMAAGSPIRIQPTRHRDWIAIGSPGWICCSELILSL